LAQAQQALGGRGLEWRHGTREPTWPGNVPRAGASPLDVTWKLAAAQREVVVGDPSYISTSDIARLVNWFRVSQRCRLMIRGGAGSGKSVFAQITAEYLFRNSQTGEPVPVFLPLWSWNPHEEGLCEWMKRRIQEDYPEFERESTYGPNPVAGLVDQGLVLPILDGLDTMPERCRQAIITDGDFMSQERLIITCRTGIEVELDTAGNFSVITPSPVALEKSITFLGQVTDSPGAWKVVYGHIGDHEHCCLGEALSEPRIIYLASTVYGTPGQYVGHHIEKNKNSPAELINHACCQSSQAVEDLLLAKLIPVLMPQGGEWAGLFPWYGFSAEVWLRNLANLDLRDTADREDSSSGRASSVSRITWWNIYNGLPWLRSRQALLRASTVGLITFALIALIVSVHHSAYSGLLSGALYGGAIFIAGILLCSSIWENSGVFLERGTRLQKINWWITNVSVRWSKEMVVASIIFISFGIVNAFSAIKEVGVNNGILIAFSGGFYVSLIFLLTFSIAGVPCPPRTMHSIGLSQLAKSSNTRFVVTILAGLSFGLASVIFTYGVDSRDILYFLGHPLRVLFEGTVTGLDFVLGAWLFRWSRIWFTSLRPIGPRSAARIELIGVVVCPIILGITFALAFGVGSLVTPFGAGSILSGAFYFVIGAALGALGSEWLLYAAAITWLAVIKNKLPLRLMIFLECCRNRGILRAIGQGYQIRDDGMQQYLLCSIGQDSGVSPRPFDPRSRGSMG
jgi:hypothetical protein